MKRRQIRRFTEEETLSIYRARPAYYKGPAITQRGRIVLETTDEDYHTLRLTAYDDGAFEVERNQGWDEDDPWPTWLEVRDFNEFLVAIKGKDPRHERTEAVFREHVLKMLEANLFGYPAEHLAEAVMGTKYGAPRERCYRWLRKMAKEGLIRRKTWGGNKTEYCLDGPEANQARIREWDESERRQAYAKNAALALTDLLGTWVRSRYSSIEFGYTALKALSERLGVDLGAERPEPEDVKRNDPIVTRDDMAAVL